MASPTATIRCGGLTTPSGTDLSLDTGAATDNILVKSGGTETHRFDGDILFIGESANAGMTAGLTINQGTAADEALALKASNVAHGITVITETDTYWLVRKVANATGGARLDCLTEATIGLRLNSFTTTPDTTKSTSADGAVDIRGHDGTSSLGADGNILTVRDAGTTRFIFDVEGSAHADVAWTTFDGHDDLAVIEDMETVLSGDAVKRRFGDVVMHDRAFFEREGILHDVREVEPGRMRGMLNTTRFLMLTAGAVRQAGGLAMDAHARIDALEAGREPLHRRITSKVRALLN